MFLFNSGEQTSDHVAFYVFLTQLNRMRMVNSIHNIQFGFYALESHKCQRESLKTVRLYILG